MAIRSIASTRAISPATLRLVMGISAWVGSFFCGYAVGLVLLGALGVPHLVVPACSGLLTAFAFHLVALRRRRGHLPSQTHIRAVDRISREMDGVTDPGQLASLVVSALQRAVRPTHLYVWLPTREQRDFALAAGAGPDPGLTSLPETWCVDFAAYIACPGAVPRGLALETGAFRRWLAGAGLSMVLPIFSQGRLVGLLTAGPRADGKDYSPGDRWLLDQMLRHSGLALSYLGSQKEERHQRSRMDNLTHLYKDAQQRAITDGLTGLATHAFFKEQLGQRFSEARRYNTPLSVVLLDIDHFKRFNDTFGHPMGDEVLCQVARAVKQEARLADTVARYGGEELALVLSQTDMPGAMTLAERVREVIEALVIADGKGRRLPTVTVSIGVAQMETADETSQVIIERADQALYVAKRQGRNQVVKAS